MKNSFTNKQTDLDLNGPYLSFDSEPQSVTGIGTTVGGTTGATVTLTGISTAGFSTDRPTVYNPPCIAVIDENTGSTQWSVDQDWNNFYAAHPDRKFYLMDVAGSYGHPTVITPTGIGTGAAPITNFTKFDVNRDDGNTENTSDWFDLAGLSSLSTGSLVTLWVDSSGSMTPSNVQASLDLFLTNCSNAGLTVEQSSNPNAYFEEYIEPFITELVGYTPPVNKGSVDYRWHEVGVGPLSDSATVTGTATTALTISNLRTPTDNGRQFFLQVDYDPQAAVGIGSTTITGNAPNEPFNSGIATVTVTPLIEITTQPALTNTFPNVATNISVVAGLSDDSFGDDTQYQWQLDGSDVSDGTITKSVEVVGNTITQTTQTDSVFIIPANVTDIIFDCAGGSGGNGGGGGVYNAGGVGGAGLAQRFTLSSSTSERTVRFEVGRRGEDGQVDGHGNGATGASNGGDGGTSGGPGGGGGGGGSTGVYVDGVRVALLAGGAGGGGGGINSVGLDGKGYDAAGGDIGLLPNDGTDKLIGVAGGGAGTSSSTDAGGGGGGAGTGAASIQGETFLSGGTAGAGGSGAGGGYKGDSEYRSDILGLGNGTNNPNSNGWGTLIYTTTTTQSVTRTTTVAGATTNTLTLSTDGAGIGYVARCVVSSATASNSPIVSDSQIYTVNVPTSVINIESIKYVGDEAVLSSVDLADGDLRFDAATSSTDSDYFLYSLYAPNKDVDVEVDLYGGSGKDQGWNNGGYGGYSKIRFTMEQNVEYVIAGLTESINTPYLYRKGTLIANVGQGGEGRGSRPRRSYQNGLGVTNSRGVDLGTVISNNGVFGASARNKIASDTFIDPTLYLGDSLISGTNGNFDGGRTITCTKGVYYAQNGVSPCQDVGANGFAGFGAQFRLSDGTILSNTATIDRGYKAGYNIIQTGGYNYDNSGGEGGNGAWGGYASGDGSVGGQGGAGYTDGSVTIIDGSGSVTGNGIVIIRVVT